MHHNSRRRGQIADDAISKSLHRTGEQNLSLDYSGPLSDMNMEQDWLWQLHCHSKHTIDRTSV